jgi:hypothetical protein
MPTWARWTLGAFGLLGVLSITARRGNTTHPDIAATAADDASRGTFDGETVFRASERDVDGEVGALRLPCCSDNPSRVTRRARRIADLVLRWSGARASRRLPSLRSTTLRQSASGRST